MTKHFIDAVRLHTHIYITAMKIIQINIYKLKLHGIKENEGLTNLLSTCHWNISVSKVGQERFNCK